MRKSAGKKRAKRSVRGKHAGRMTGAGIVLLDPDVAQAFPDAESVNRALRAIIEIAPRERRARLRPR